MRVCFELENEKTREQENEDATIEREDERG